MIVVLVQFVILMLASVPLSAQESPSFADNFENRTMRIDYHHAADAKREFITLDKIYIYGTWAGSTTHLLDELGYGAYCCKIYDAASGNLLYSKGFDSYCKEYMTSRMAKEGTMKTFHESALVPLPRKEVFFSLEKRSKDGIMHEIFRCRIDPEDVNIIKDEGVDESVKVFKSLYNGDPHRKVDVAFVGEGYTAEEETKFRNDLKRFTDVFFAREPCRSSKKDFNVYGVFKPSQESGTDEPRHGSFRNTLLGTTFNSLGSERYLLTEDNKTLRDVAGRVPYDAIYIMVNHNRYGGGGIYNLYCTFTTDNQWSEYLMVHEFGHSFFGLADEYYTSSVAYEDFYPKGYEPVEPNITALLDPENVKWKSLLTKGIEIPTPWEKEQYDEADLAWQEERRKLNDEIARLRREGAPEDEVRALQRKYDEMDRRHSEEMHEFLRKSRYFGKVGAFEGAGYASKGLYRPMVDCIMFTKGSPVFCKVCEEAMKRVIRNYTE